MASHNPEQILNGEVTGDVHNSDGTTNHVKTIHHQTNIYNTRSSGNVATDQYDKRVTETLPPDLKFLRKTIGSIIENHPIGDFDDIIADDLGVDAQYKTWKKTEGKDSSKTIQVKRLFEIWRLNRGNDATALGMIEALKNRPQAKLIIDEIRGKCLPSVELIRYQNGQLIFNPDAEKIIEENNKPAEVIAMLGQLKTGKSYFLNRIKEGPLDKSSSGYPVFPYGDNEDERTRGVRMWVGDHPNNKNKSLILLDIEGIYGEDEHDTKLITIAILLCSTLVYCSAGDIDDDALQALGLLSQVAEKIKASSPANIGTQEFMSPVPKLVWSVCNHYERFTFNYHNNYYLNKSLTSKDEYYRWSPASSKKKEKQINSIREKINVCFKDRQCFLHPSPGKNIAIAKTPFDKLDSGFQKSSSKFVTFLHNQENYKEVRGDSVAAHLLMPLTKKYINAINNQQSVTINSAFDEVMKEENDNIFNEAVEVYQREMKNLAIHGKSFDLARQHATSGTNALHAISDKISKQTNGRHKMYVQQLIKKRLTLECERFFLQKYYNIILTSSSVNNDSLSKDLQLLENIMTNQTKETRKIFMDNLMQHLWKLWKNEGWLDGQVFAIFKEIQSRSTEFSLDLPPLEFITTKVVNGKSNLVMNKLAVKILQNIDKPVEVISVVGETSKIQLLNNVRGKNVFESGSEETDGVWMWVGDHPMAPGKALILLDTQGLGANTKHNNNMFAIAFLLSSTLVYKGNVDDKAPTLFMSSLSKHIQLTSSSSADSSFNRWFRGEEKGLSTISPKLVVAGNQPPGLKHHEDSMKQLMMIFKDLEYVDLSSINKNASPIKESRIKKIAGFEISPNILVSLTQNYLNDINNSSTVKIESALQSLLPTSFESAVKTTVANYKNAIPNLPMIPSFLDNAHKRSSNAALRVYQGANNQLSMQSYQLNVIGNMCGQIINKTLEEEYNILKVNNMKESQVKCQKFYKESYDEFNEKIVKEKQYSRVTRDEFNHGLTKLKEKIELQLNDVDIQIMNNAKLSFTEEIVKPLELIQNISLSIQEKVDNEELPIFPVEKIMEINKNLSREANTKFSNGFIGEKVRGEEFLDLLNLLLKEQFKQLKDKNQKAGLGKAEKILEGYYSFFAQQARGLMKTNKEIFEALNLFETLIKNKPEDADNSTWEEAVKTFMEDTVIPLRVIEKEFNQFKKKVHEIKLPVVQATLAKNTHTLCDEVKIKLTNKIGNTDRREDFLGILKNLLENEEHAVKESNISKNREECGNYIQNKYAILQKQYTCEGGIWKLDSDGCDIFINNFDALKADLKKPVNELDPECWNIALKEIIGSIQEGVNVFANYRGQLNAVPLPITSVEFDLKNDKFLQDAKAELQGNEDSLDILVKLADVEYAQKRELNKQKSLKKCRDVLKSLYSQFHKEFSDAINDVETLDKAFMPLKMLQEKTENEIKGVDLPIWREVKTDFLAQQVKPVNLAEEVFIDYILKNNNLKLPMPSMDLCQKTNMFFEEATCRITTIKTRTEESCKSDMDEFFKLFEKLLEKKKTAIEKKNTTKNWIVSKEILKGHYDSFQKHLDAGNKTAFFDGLRKLETASENNSENLDNPIWLKANRAFTNEIVQSLQVVEKVIKMSNSNSLKNITLPITEAALRRYKKNIENKAMKMYDEDLLNIGDLSDDEVKNDQEYNDGLTYFKEIAKGDKAETDIGDGKKVKFNVFQAILLQQLEKEVADLESENNKELDKQNEDKEEQYYALSNILSKIGLAELEDMLEKKGITAENFSFLTEERLQKDKIGTAGQKLTILNYNKKLRDEELLAEKERGDALQLKLDELEAKLEVENCTKMSLQQNLLTAERILCDTEKQVQSIKKELEETNHKLEKEIEKGKLKTKEIEESEIKLKAQTDEIVRLQQNLTQKNQEAKQTENSLRETTERLERKATHVEMLVQDNKQIRKQTFRIQENLKKKEVQVHSTKKELEESNNKLQNAIEQAKLKTKEIEESEIKLKAQSDEIVGLQQNLTLKNQEAEQFENNLREITETLERKATHVEMLVQDNKQIRKQTFRLQENLKKKEEQVHSIRKELEESNNNLQNEIESAKLKTKEVEESETKLKAQSDEMVALQQILTLKSQEAEKSENNIRETTERLERKATHVEMLERTLKAQTKQTFRLQENMKNLVDKELDIKKLRIMDLEAKLKEARRKLNTCPLCKNPGDEVGKKEVDKMSPLDSNRKLSMDAKLSLTPSRRSSSILSIPNLQRSPSVQSLPVKNLSQESKCIEFESLDQKKKLKDVLKYYQSEVLRLNDELDSANDRCYLIRPNN